VFGFSQRINKQSRQIYIIYNFYEQKLKKEKEICEQTCSSSLVIPCRIKSCSINGQDENKFEHKPNVRPIRVQTVNVRGLT
ncbi:unnamed protein product, partial [Rotaria magnacalcarata]